MTSSLKISRFASDAQRGDKTAVSELLRACWPMAFKIARRYIKDYDDISDICQEAIIHLYRDLKNYQSSRPFDPWFQRIVMHTIIDHVRRKKRKRTVSLTVDIQDLKPGPDAKLLHARIIQAAKTLPSRKRRVFLLRDVCGLRCKEVASIMGLESCTVSNLSKAARKDIRTALEGTNKL